MGAERSTTTTYVWSVTVPEVVLNLALRHIAERITSEAWMAQFMDKRWGCKRASVNPSATLSSFSSPVCLDIRKIETNNLHPEYPRVASAREYLFDHCPDKPVHI